MGVKSVKVVSRLPLCHFKTSDEGSLVSWNDYGAGLGTESLPTPLGVLSLPQDQGFLKTLQYVRYGGRGLWVVSP